MRSSLIFDEPSAPRVGPFQSTGDWYLHSDSPEARAARSEINKWYSTFPDRDGMVLSRLRGNDEIGAAQALDELYVHHLLSGYCEARYEEGEQSPDFRLYRSGNYLAGIEVLTLFAESRFDSQIARNSRLVDELNNRVKSSTWLAAVRAGEWVQKPKITDIARWLETAIDRLPQPTPDMAGKKCFSATYSRGDFELHFAFMPREPVGAARQPKGIVQIGPAVFGFTQPERRLRKAISMKIGSRYDHRDQPFAVFVVVRDFSFDDDALAEALYGDVAVAYVVDEPGSSELVRKETGTFGLSRVDPGGKNRRLSCVFALMRGVTPGSQTEPPLIRCDNPFAERSFPEDILAPGFRYIAERDGKKIRMVSRTIERDV